MFVLQANNAALTVQAKEVVASGSVNTPTVRFLFSPEWAGLTRTAVFRAGGVAKSVLLDGSNQCAIPWEVLKTPRKPLQAGVFGCRGQVVILPTPWAELGVIRDGAAPGEDAVPPTPDLWQQELAAKGDSLGYTEDGALGLWSGDKLLSSVLVQGGSGPGPGAVATNAEVDEMLDGVFGPETK